MMATKVLDRMEVTLAMFGKTTQTYTEASNSILRQLKQHRIVILTASTFYSKNLAYL